MKNYTVQPYKDNENKTRYGIEFSKEEIQPYLDKLAEYLGPEGQEFIEYRNQRDGDRYIMDVIDRRDMHNLIAYFGNVKTADGLEDLCKIKFNDIEFQGIGQASNDKHKTYYIVCKSPVLENYRKGLGLGVKNFIITIAFDGKDVHKKKGEFVEKDEDSIIIHNV